MRKHRPVSPEPPEEDSLSLDTMPEDLDAFTTRSLSATRVREADYGDLCRMHADPVTMATLGGVRSDETTRRFLDEKLAHWNAHGHGLWIFRARDDGRFIGRGLLEYIVVGGGRELEVGYSVIAPEWGRGFATEMARAIVSIAFSLPDVESIVSFTWPDNAASRRVMEKVGFRFERDIEHVGHPQLLYRQRRSEYYEHTGRNSARSGP
jgi:ribosomal-protein-alanine N-acetyltransferase